MARIHWWIYLATWDLLLIFPTIFVLFSVIADTVEGQVPSTTDRDAGSPSFVDTRREIKVVQSNMAILPCSVKNLGDRQVVWRRLNGDEFLTIGAMVWTKDHRVIVDFDVDDDGTTTWDLLIRNVQFSDAGVYECQITSIEFLTRNVELKVFEKPTPRARAKLHRLTTLSPTPSAKLPSAGHHYLTHRQEMVTAGLPIRLVCNTSLGNTSMPRSSLEWFKDGYNIHSSKHVLLTRYQFETDRMYVSELLIDQSTESDTGEYKCRLENDELFKAKILVLPKTQKRSRKDQAHYYATDTLHADKGNAGSCITPSGNNILLCLFVVVLVMGFPTSRTAWRGSHLVMNNSEFT